MKKLYDNVNLSRIFHQIQKKVEIMQSVETHSQNFSRKIKMPQVGSAVLLAGIALAFRVEWFGVFAETCLFDRNLAMAGEERPITSVTCGKDAIEHINTCFDSFKKIPGFSNTHQVTRKV